MILKLFDIIVPVCAASHFPEPLIPKVRTVCIEKSNHDTRSLVGAIIILSRVKKCPRPCRNAVGPQAADIPHDLSRKVEDGVGGQFKSALRALLIIIG